MAELLMLTLDADLAGHLAVALRVHRAGLERERYPEPRGLADLEQLALKVVRATQAHSGGVTRRSGLDYGMHDREWFTRTEASQYAGVSIATIDRWVQDGLPSSKRGRLRRIARADLARFLHPA